MAEKVKGELKVVKANDHGFYSVKIGDKWYGTGKKQAPSGVAQGDTVEGEFELEKGKYATITKAGLSKASSASAEAAAPAAKGSSAGTTDWVAKDASIRYQSSRKDALSYLALPGVLTALGLEKAKPADKIGIVDAVLDKYTAAFYDDVSTFGAVTRVNAPAVDPSAPPSEEDDE